MSESRTKRPPQQTSDATPSPSAATETPAAPGADVPPASPGRMLPPPGAAAARLDAFASFDATHAALTDSAAAIADEFADVVRVSIDSAAEAATGLLAARTMGDAFAVGAGLARRNLDAALARSLRLTEIGARLTTGTWDRLLPLLGASPAA